MGGSLRHVIIMRGLCFASVGRFSFGGQRALVCRWGFRVGVVVGFARSYRSVALALSPLGPAPLGGVGMPNYSMGKVIPTEKPNFHILQNLASS